MKAGIVGVGRLGGAIAFALAREGTWDELVLHDVVERLAGAPAEDIRDGLGPRIETVVRAGSLEDLGDMDVVLLVAGQGRKPGMTRLDLLHANTAVVADTSRTIARAARKATLVVLTNPLDVMTTVAWRASGLPRERVLGSGGLVDSVRLRGLLADRRKVDPADVEATALGEHGDRVVAVFSRARIRGEPLDLPPAEAAAIVAQLKDVSAHVIEVKGGTTFGPAGATAALLHALMAHTPSVVPASVVLAGEYGLRDVAVGVPAVVGQGRVLKVEEWELAPDELGELQEAGRDLAKFVEDAELLLDRGVRLTSLESLGPPPPPG